MALPVEIYVQEESWKLEKTTPPQSFDNSGLSLSTHRAPISPQTWQQWFQQWLDCLSADLPPAPCYELSLCLTSDLGIQALNAQYRHLDQPTDVLAFATLEVNCPQPPELLQTQALYLGDIIISVETADRQAQQQQHSLTTELAWLAAHGCLHLLGWDHPDQDSLNRMIDQQLSLLQTVKLNAQLVNDRDG